jgi:hypothetical protein
LAVLAARVHCAVGFMLVDDGNGNVFVFRQTVKDGSAYGFPVYTALLEDFLNDSGN